MLCTVCVKILLTDSQEFFCFMLVTFFFELFNSARSGLTACNYMYASAVFLLQVVLKQAHQSHCGSTWQALQQCFQSLNLHRTSEHKVF